MSTLLLSRTKLTTFLECRRRFQLRYLEQRPWPSPPLATNDEERLGLGQQFHQLVQRHFLGLPVEAASISNRSLRGWWLSFERFNPVPSTGRRLPELTLTIPIRQQLLHGRFDLLLIGEKDGTPFAHIYDWKTGQPREESALRHDWQTRLYLALLAEGGSALWGEGDEGDRTLSPEQISLTYWYVSTPEASVTIPYSQQWHTSNWADLLALTAQIEAQQTAADGDIWPLTDDYTQCRMCAYQALCGRQETGSAQSNLAVLLSDEENDDLTLFELEPALP